MKIRLGLVLSLALGFGLSGCASGGGSSSGTAPEPSAIPGGEALVQGERPRQDDNTRAAQRALEGAFAAADDASAEPLYRQALQAAQAGIAGDSTNPLAWRLAGEASMGVGDYREADRFLSRAEQLRPIYEFETQGLRERAWIDLYQEAVPLVNAAQYEDAAAIFEQANAIYYERPEVMITLGQIYAQLRRHDDAIELLDQALEVINSDQALEMDAETLASWQEQAAEIPFTRAQILVDAGRFDDAAAVFRELAAADPDNMVVRRSLAAVLVQMGSEAEAFAVYDELMEMPLSPNDYYAIGAGYYQGGAYDRAAEAFGAAAGASPRDRDAIEMWARSLAIDSAYAAIPPVAERWIELDPNNQNAYLILAQALQRAGDSQAAGQAVGRIESLAVTLDNLSLTRFPGGGGQVSGALTNKSLSQGADVTLAFTFYDEAGRQIGTQNHTMAAPAADMSQVFQVEFSSTETVGGYGYTIR